MTKEQFISGTPFYIGGKTYKGANTYCFKGEHITSQIRSSIDERVICDDHEVNVRKVGRVGFEGYTFVMKKRVVVKYRFSDLVEFVEEA